jgi:hypothetical protein
MPTMLTDNYQWLADGTDGLPDFSQGIQCCKPSKSCKIDEKIRKILQNLVGITALYLNSQ